MRELYMVSWRSRLRAHAYGNNFADFFGLHDVPNCEKYAPWKGCAQRRPPENQLVDPASWPDTTPVDDNYNKRIRDKVVFDHSLATFSNKIAWQIPLIRTVPLVHDVLSEHEMVLPGVTAVQLYDTINRTGDRRIHG
eukprot:scaffold965_cov158-Amphora_coffeaeformis.AAC.4